MNQLDKRVTGLERTAMSGSNAPTLYTVSFMTPGREDPVKTGVGVLGERGDGKLLFSSDFATEDEFTTAVNNWHVRVHGRPIKGLTGGKA